MTQHFQKLELIAYLLFQYDEYKSPMENIGMQDSLLSRFDLLFIILDKHIRETDEQIADHVMRMHRYRSPNEQDGERKLHYPS